MIRIVADNKIPFIKGAFEGVAKIAYLPGDRISKSDLTDADVLITRTRTKCNRELLEGTGVRYIATATIGYDHIDTEFCDAAGIRWTNAPGCNAASVQQYVVSSLLYLFNLRKLDPKKMTLGVVGVGNVGGKVAAAAKILGMKVLLNDPPRQRIEGDCAFVTLDHLLENSDIVTLHVPLNKGGMDNTFQMVNEEFTEKMKQGAIMFNTSRGKVVDEIVLLNSIRAGKLADVVLDVFPQEPEINPELLKAITLGTPHIAGYSTDGKVNGTIMSVQAISRFFGLGLDAWEPASVPAPESIEIQLDARRSKLIESLWEVFRQSYDVTKDDQDLRMDPGRFEYLRGNYPLRREPFIYSVRLFQGYEELRTKLELLGFSVLSI